MRRAFTTLVVLLFCLVPAVGCIGLGIHRGLLVERQKDWPPVEAVIRSSHETERTNRSQVLWVRYEYERGGQRFEGAGSLAVSPPQRPVPPQYAPGKSLTVLYNPADPATSVLERGSHGDTVFFILFGSIWLLLTSPILIFYALMFYAYLMLKKARYHFREGMRALEEGCAGANALQDEHGEMPEELAERGEQVIAKAVAAEKLLLEVEGQFEEMTGEPAPQAGRRLENGVQDLGEIARLAARETDKHI